MSCLSFLAPQGQIAALARDTVALSHKEYSTPKPPAKPEETAGVPITPAWGGRRRETHASSPLPRILTGRRRAHGQGLVTRSRGDSHRIAERDALRGLEVDYGIEHLEAVVSELLGTNGRGKVAGRLEAGDAAASRRIEENSQSLDIPVGLALGYARHVPGQAVFLGGVKRTGERHADRGGPGSW